MSATADLLSDATAALKPLLDAAYSAGFSAGYKVGEVETMKRVKARVADLFDYRDDEGAADVESLNEHADDSQSDEASERAAPGTVKPAILNLLRESRVGMTTRQISDVTGFKHNSVRGTVWALQKDGDIVKGEGNRWVATKSRDSSNPHADSPLGTLLQSVLRAEENEPPNAEAEDGSEPDEQGESNSPDRPINPAL